MDQTTGGPSSLLAEQPHSAAMPASVASLSLPRHPALTMTAHTNLVHDWLHSLLYLGVAKSHPLVSSFNQFYLVFYAKLIYLRAIGYDALASQTMNDIR